MFDINKICVVGGDIRQAYLGDMFLKDGKFVTYQALEKCEYAQPDYASLETAVSKCDTVILPVPLSKDGQTLNTPLSDMTIPLDSEFADILKNKCVFCANSDMLTKSGNYESCRIFDYMKNEDLVVLNAALTAEAALGIAINNSDISILKSKCLVAGFGRIGKFLARELKFLGADVTASARKSSDMAWITACGYTAVETENIAENIGEFDFIFNTIPHMIFNTNVISKISRNAVIIDLASKPGGTDFETCRKMNIKAISALSLPGKTAPKSAAEIIKNTIYKLSEEKT